MEQYYLRSLRDNYFCPGSSGAGIPEYLNYNDYYTTGTANWRFNADIFTTFGSWKTTLFDANSMTSDPQFINPGGTHAADYKRASYPANGRGGAYAPVMGAYMNGDKRIGHLPPPTNLR